MIGYQDPEHGVVVTGPDGKPVNPRSPAQLADMFAYAADLAERKRHEPADDVMTALVQAEVDGERLTDAELKMFFFLLVIAGNDTVRSALPGGVLLLLRHPDGVRAAPRRPVAAAVGDRGDAAAAPARADVPPHRHPRPRRSAAGRSGRATRWSSTTCRPTSTSAASPTRSASTSPASPNDHVAFGQGPHLCLGRGVRAAADAGVLRRAPGAGELRLDGEPRRLTSNFINGLTSLPVTI